jgi:hypothetical protein
MFMTVSVIVLIVDIRHSRRADTECDAPVAADHHRPGPLSRPAQFVEAKTWQTHVARRCGHVEAAEDEPQARRVSRLDSSTAPRFEEGLQALVPESDNGHGNIVT